MQAKSSRFNQSVQWVREDNRVRWMHLLDATD